MTQQFTIKQASALTLVSPYTLRYYERIGLIDGVKKTGSGHRSYSQKDIEWIIFLSLFRGMGMSIQEMLRFADMKRGGINRAPDRKAFLEQYKKDLQLQIQERQKIIKLVNLKLSVLDSKIDTNDQEADSLDFERLIKWRENL
ncbi:MAG: MerR family transcriptional regulator [Candidatus Saccharibacteria bacterium]|nr:MerR family transcriptional regulator [Candidatus Saccharibacteria bacterium]